MEKLRTNNKIVNEQYITNKRVPEKNLLVDFFRTNIF